MFEQDTSPSDPDGVQESELLTSIPGGIHPPGGWGVPQVPTSEKWCEYGDQNE